MSGETTDVTRDGCHWAITQCVIESGVAIVECFDQCILTTTLCRSQFYAPKCFCSEALAAKRFLYPQVIDEQSAVFRPTGCAGDDAINLAQETGDGLAVAVESLTASERENAIADDR